MPYYLGRRPQGDWILFASPAPPTKETHSHRFSAVRGPFRTRLAALWFDRYGQGNPQVRTVADAERLAREAASENLIVAQWLLEESMSAQEREEMYAFEAYEQAIDEGVGRLHSMIDLPIQAEAEMLTA